MIVWQNFLQEETVIHQAEAVNIALDFKASFCFYYYLSVVLVFRILFPISKLKLLLLTALHCFRVCGKLWKWGSLLLRICFDGLIKFSLSTVTVPGDKRSNLHGAPKPTRKAQSHQMRTI